MMPGIIISFIFSEHSRLVFCTSPTQNQLTCVSQPVDDATHWFSIQVDTANLPRSAWSYLFAFQQSCLDQAFDAAMAHATYSRSLIQADSVWIG